MIKQLEGSLVELKLKLAALDRKIQNQPGSRYLKDIRNSYKQAINAAETTLESVSDLNPMILDTVASWKKQ